MPCNLCCYFVRDHDGTPNFDPRKCIEKMIECHFNVFGSDSKLNVMSPLDKGDYLELDTSEHLD